MSYLVELVQRVTDPVTGLRPRLASTFEPLAETESPPDAEPDSETETQTSVRRAVARAPVAAEGASRGTTPGTDTPRPPDEEDASASARPPVLAPVPARRRDPAPTAGTTEPVEEDATRDATRTRSGRPETPPRTTPGADRHSSAPDTGAPPAAPSRVRGTPLRAREVAAEERAILSAPMVTGSRSGRSPHPAPADVRAIAAAGAAPRRGAAGDPVVASVVADEPVVHVTIGRIDVRAAEPSRVALEAPAQTGPEPLRLEDYLRQRDAGER